MLLVRNLSRTVILKALAEDPEDLPSSSARAELQVQPQTQSQLSGFKPVAEELPSSSRVNLTVQPQVQSQLSALFKVVQVPGPIAERIYSAFTCQNDLRSLLFPTVAVALAALGILHLALRNAKQDAISSDQHDDELAAKIVRRVGFYLSLTDNIMFTMVIPDSYSLIQSLGGGATLSGIMIGITKCGTCATAIGLGFALRRYENIWRDHARVVLLVASCCNIIASSVYTFIAAVALNSVDKEMHIYMLAALVLSRMTLGFGAGLRLQLSRTHIARLTPKECRPAEQEFFLLGVMLGIGLGPLVAAAVKYLDICHNSLAQRYEAVGLASLAISFTQFVAVFCIPPLAGCRDWVSSEVQKSGLCFDAPELNRRWRILKCCLIISLLRGICVCGTEAGTAMLLEVEHNWSIKAIGFSISLAFLSCLPFRMAYKKYNSHFSFNTWMQSLISLSMIGAFLIFPYKSGEESAYLILLGDVLLFPTFYLTDAMAQGVMVQHTLPKEISFLDINGVTMLNTILLDGIARPLGMPLARFEVDRHGQFGYALQLLFLTICAGLVIEFGLLPDLVQAATNTSPRSQDTKTGTLDQRSMSSPVLGLREEESEIKDAERGTRSAAC